MNNPLANLSHTERELLAQLSQPEQGIHWPTIAKTTQAIAHSQPPRQSNLADVRQAIENHINRCSLPSRQAVLIRLIIGRACANDLKTAIGFINRCQQTSK